MDFTLNRTWPIFYDYIPVNKIWIQYSSLFKKYRKENICWRWIRAITPLIMGGFYPKLNMTSILWLYICVLNMNPIHWCFQKISNGNCFQCWKKYCNSQNNWWILPSIELNLYFIIIYPCIKYESNTLIFSKDIERKLFFKAEKGP